MISSLSLQKLKKKKFKETKEKGENLSPWSLEELSPVILHFSFVHNCPCLANQEKGFSSAWEYSWTLLHHAHGSNEGKI